MEKLQGNAPTPAPAANTDAILVEAGVARLREVRPEAAQSYPYLRQLIQLATEGKPATAALVYPCDATSLQSAYEIVENRLARVVLVGPAIRIREALAHAGRDPEKLTIVDTPNDPTAAARCAVQLLNDGGADILMKGSLHTDELMGVVVGREAGLRGTRRISHAFVLDVPALAAPLMLTDCVVNINPGLAEKIDIVRNAIDLARSLGIDQPRIGVLSAVETVNPALPGTLDAAALAKMADRKQIEHAIIDGPFALDNVLSPDSLQIKGIESAVAGRPDILLVPGLEAGNMLYKSMIYVGHAQCAGVILGTRAPIVLTSRADSAFTRLASCALALIHWRATCGSLSEQYKQ